MLDVPQTPHLPNHFIDVTQISDPLYNFVITCACHSSAFNILSTIQITSLSILTKAFYSFANTKYSQKIYLSTVKLPGYTAAQVCCDHDTFLAKFVKKLIWGENFAFFVL